MIVVHKCYWKMVYVTTSVIKLELLMTSRVSSQIFNSHLKIITK